MSKRGGPAKLFQQCQRTPKYRQKNSPDQRDYAGYSCLKQLFRLSPKNIKKILFQNLYFKTVPAMDLLLIEFGGDFAIMQRNGRNVHRIVLEGTRATTQH